jgi:uncharacterized protein (TIGR00255 family)
MNSMTGFGSATRRDRRFDVEVEVRSVNHRFLVLKQSLPEDLSRLEGEIEQAVRERLSRGSLTLSLSVKAASEDGPVLPDEKIFKETARRLREVAKSLKLSGELGMGDLLAVPGLWQRSGPELPMKELAPKVLELVEKAVDQLVATRQREGAAIEKDLRGRLETIEGCAARVKTRVPAVVDAYQRKLDERVRALLAQKGLEVGKTDLAKEVAVYADRCDVSEEVQRLQAHVAEFRKVTASKGAIGRRLDFLTQEMGREANTIASKGNDAEVSAAAVEIKSELEKIKEQVENVE